MLKRKAIIIRIVLKKTQFNALVRIKMQIKHEVLMQGFEFTSVLPKSQAMLHR